MNPLGGQLLGLAEAGCCQSDKQLLLCPLVARMHLCDFGADLDVCKGPDAEFEPRCTGPGGREEKVPRSVSIEKCGQRQRRRFRDNSHAGTQFSPSRLYGYTQWAVQKFTKQA